MCIRDRLGRFFIILFGDHPDSAAHAVNMLSAFASGFTILFLFWTVTHFARKMFVTVGEEMTTQQLFTIMSAGVVGAMAYCFSCLLYTSPSPRDRQKSRMPSSA